MKITNKRAYEILEKGDIRNMSLKDLERFKDSKIRQYYDTLRNFEKDSTQDKVPLVGKRFAELLNARSAICKWENKMFAKAIELLGKNLHKHNKQGFKTVKGYQA